MNYPHPSQEPGSTDTFILVLCWILFIQTFPPLPRPQHANAGMQTACQTHKTGSEAGANQYIK